MELHLPAVDMTAMLKDVDREYVKQHPVMKGVLEEERKRVACEDRKRGRVVCESDKRGSLKVSDGDSAMNANNDDSVNASNHNSANASNHNSINASNHNSINASNHNSIHTNNHNSIHTNNHNSSNPTNRDSYENRKKPKLRISPSSFLNVNAPLQDEVKEEKKDFVPITDLDIERGKMSEEELSSLPQMRNVG